MLSAQWSLCVFCYSLYSFIRAAGLSEEDIAKIHAPIGLPIKAVTPQEIAVSIAAEMILVRAERRLG